MVNSLKRYFDDLRWQRPDDVFLKNNDPQTAYVFRGHQALSEEDATLRVMGLRHGSFLFDTASSYGAPLMSKKTPFFLPKATGFLSVYRSFSEQLFFPDETMEYILMGQDIGRPVVAGETELHAGNAFETHIDLRPGKNQWVGTYAVRRVGFQPAEIAEIASSRDELALLLEENRNPAFEARVRQSSRTLSFEHYIDKIEENLAGMSVDHAAAYYTTLKALTEDRIQSFIPQPCGRAGNKKPYALTVAAD